MRIYMHRRIATHPPQPYLTLTRWKKYRAVMSTKTGNTNATSATLRLLYVCVKSKEKKTMRSTIKQTRRSTSPARIYDVRVVTTKTTKTRHAKNRTHTKALFSRAPQKLLSDWLPPHIDGATAVIFWPPVRVYPSFT